MKANGNGAPSAQQRWVMNAFKNRSNLLSLLICRGRKQTGALVLVLNCIRLAGPGQPLTSATCSGWRSIAGRVGEE